MIFGRQLWIMRYITVRPTVSPVDGGNYAWIYNKNMFDKLNITVPEEGFTWDEFKDVLPTDHGE